ncbi:MAG: bifunctional nuclease family protein [Coriobacteriales bacterium]|jgi:bifunctional DNase/RNase|nr:bifunctional nuclease family protein [Coriobacteriales bacterium]
MVEVSIFSVVIVGSALPSVVVLTPKKTAVASQPNQSNLSNQLSQPRQPKSPKRQSQLVLPIWIGRSEATAIYTVLEKQAYARPMAHDLLANTIRALGAHVIRVVIDRVKDAAFFATIYLNRDGRTINLDARPSDSIALALRLQAPIFVDEDVINAAGRQFTAKISDGGDLLEDSEEAMEEFRDFLGSISPEDFVANE